MKVKYRGPHPSVEIAEAPEIGNATDEDGEPVILRDKPVEVPDDLAVRLLEQEDNWAPVGADAKEKAAAAATTATAGA